MSENESLNPYAPPRAVTESKNFTPGSGGQFRAFLSDGALAVGKSAELPDICVKCARTDDLVMRPQSFAWYPRWVFLFLFCNVIIFAIVGTIVQKKGKLTLPICSDCQAKWKQGSLIWGLSILGMFTLPFIIGAMTNFGVGVFLFFATLVGCIVVNLMVLRPRSVWAKKIDNVDIYLSGVHPEAVDVILQAANGPAANAYSPGQAWPVPMT